MTDAVEETTTNDAQDVSTTTTTATENDPTTTTTTTTSKTALIVLGNAMFFQPSADVIAVTIYDQSAMRNCFNNSGAKEGSLDTIHIVVQPSGVNTIYDGDAIGKHIVSYLNPMGGTITVHIVPAGGEAGEKPSDDHVGSIQMSLVMAGLRMKGIAEGDDGSRQITGQLGSNALEEEDEEDSSDDDKQ